MGAHRRKRSAQQPRVDWSLTGGGAASSAATAALGLAAAAATGNALDISHLWGAGAAVAGAATSVAVGAHNEASPGLQLLNLARWAGAGGWLTWCLVNTPWDVNALLTLLVGSGVAAGLGAAVDRTRPQEDEKAAGGLVLRSQVRLAREWEERLDRITSRKGHQVADDIRHWDTGAGYSLTVTPPGGVTRKTLAPFMDSLAGDAKLPEGCGVEADRGPHRGAVVLHVSTVDRMRSSIDYPADYAPQSIMEPLTLGEHRDSSPAQVRWREHSALFAGQKGSGKTTLLNVATAEAGRCTDVLVWHIDLTGGGLSRAWLEPWLQGETDRPAIDWAVCTEQDAEQMVKAGLAISKGRKASAFEKKLAADSTLLPISEDLPEILIVVDEGKTLLSPTARGLLGRIRQGLEEVQDIARDSAVNLVLSTLRATSDTLSPGIKKQAITRGAMAGSDDEEIAYLLGWRNLSVDDLAGAGTGFLTDGEAPRPFRCYNLSPRRIGELARLVSQRQPVLDGPSAEAAGEAYANRYARMRETFGAPGGAVVPAAENTPARASGPAGPVRLHSVPMDASNWLNDEPEEDGARPAAPQPQGTSSPADWSLPTRSGGERPEEPAGAGSGQVPEIIAAALAAFDEADDDRMHSEDLAAALGVSSTWALSDALRPFEIATLPNKFSRGGVARRGYAREAFEEVAQRHQKGAAAGAA